MRKITLIIGATGDIGAEISLKFAQDGYALLLSGRSLPKLQALQERILHTYPSTSCRYKVLDLKDPTALSTLCADISEEYGQIYAIIHAAGLCGGGRTVDISMEDWENILRINLTSAFSLAKYALQFKILTTGGRLLFIASTGGKQGVLYGLPYCAAKHGLVGLTKSLGLELAHQKTGITVNAICPGFVETQMAQKVRSLYATLWDTGPEETRRRIEARIPIGRYIQAQEVAQMAAYLASEGAGGITAQAMNICGGLGTY